MSRLIAVLLLVCLSSASPVAAQAAREWTVMCYFVSDDNKDASLEESQVKNIDELSSRGSGAGYDLVVQVDRSNKISEYLRSRYADPDYSGAKRYHIERDKWAVQAKLGEVNMGDPKSLLDFMTWAAVAYPAKHYLLLINSHGSGTLSWRGPGSTADSQPGRVVLPVNRYVAYDDTDDDCLTVFELATVLEQFALQERRPKLDILALDACLAASIEALHQLKDGVDLLVASEATVPGHGFRYTSIVDSVAAGAAPEALAGVITKSFIERAGAPNVLGAFRTSVAEDLTRAVSKLARELYVAGRELGKVGVRDLTNFGDNYWDLERIAGSIAHGGSNATSAAHGAEVLRLAKEVLELLKQSRVSLWYSGDYAKAEVGGLSILWPGADSYRKYRAFYKATGFARAGLWDEFLDWRELGMEAPAGQ